MTHRFFIENEDDTPWDRFEHGSDEPDTVWVLPFARAVTAESRLRGDPNEALHAALQGQVPAITQAAIAALEDREDLDLTVIHAMRSLLGGLHAAVLIALADCMPQFSLVDMDYGMHMSTMPGEDGISRFQVRLGGGAWITSDCEIMIPAVPEVVLQSLAGHPMTRVIDHPAIPVGTMIASAETLPQNKVYQTIRGLERRPVVKASMIDWSPIR